MKRAWLVALASLALAAGCFADDRHRTVVVEEPAPGMQQPGPTQTPATVTIVTGGTVSTDPGKGAGVFVEYLGQGQWSIWTSCDSAIQNVQCQYDLFLTPEQGGTITGGALDPQTGTLTTSPTGADAHWVTTFDTNAVNLTVTPPGAALLVEARLDGVDDPHVFYWQGIDTVHTGAPTNPALFVPTVP